MKDEFETKGKKINYFTNGRAYLKRIVRCISWLNLSKAVVPSTRTALILSRKLDEVPTGGCRSFNMSNIFGCRKNATTLSL